jgi:hypothetical protein
MASVPVFFSGSTKLTDFNLLKINGIGVFSNYIEMREI